MSKSVANHEIVTLAVYLLGGDSKHVDTEDVAVKANELAPGRFTWKKYPDQIHLEHIRVYLSDAKKPSKGSFLLGSGRQGWLLTERGLAFARENVNQIQSSDLSRAPLTPQQRQWIRRERERMLTSAAFSKLIAGLNDEISDAEVESFFGLSDYIVGKVRERKLTRMLNLLGEDEDLGPTIYALVGRVRGK